MRAHAVLLAAALFAVAAAAPSDRGQRRAVWLNGLKNGCASGMATVCAKTLLQPFDTVKTLQQANKATGSMISVCSELLSSHGVLALYRGLGVSFIGAVPSISLYFAIYQSCKQSLLTNVRAPTLVLVAISAALANMVAATVRVPCELVKQRIQAGIHTDILSAVRSIGAAGVSGFLPRGALLAQLARDIPFGVVMLLVYESLKREATARVSR